MIINYAVFGLFFYSKLLSLDSDTTTLIGEDTDLLVLLLYYAQGATMDLYFKSDRSKPDGSFKVYDINRLKDILGHDLCSQLLFIHAMTGCDTTSQILVLCLPEACKRRPCPSVLCQCFHHPKPDHTDYRRPWVPSDVFPL